MFNVTDEMYDSLLEAVGIGKLLKTNGKVGFAAASKVPRPSPMLNNASRAASKVDRMKPGGFNNMLMGASRNNKPGRMALGNKGSFMQRFVQGAKKPKPGMMDV